MQTTSFLLQFQERAGGTPVRGNVKTKTDAREDDDVARDLRARVKTFTESREEPDQDASARLVPDVGTKTATRESNDMMRALDLLTRTETRTREESDQDASSPSYFTFPRT